MQKLDYSSPSIVRDKDPFVRERIREMIIVIVAVLIVVAVPFFVMLIREWR